MRPAPLESSAARFARRAASALRTLDDLLGAPDLPLVLSRSGDDYYVWRHRSGSTWARWLLRKDALKGTGMYGVKGAAVITVQSWTGFAGSATNFSGGTWSAVATGSNTNCGLGFYSVSGSFMETTFDTPGGDLWLAYFAGADRGFVVVTIDGSSTPVNGPGVSTSGANKVFDGYVGADALGAQTGSAATTLQSIKIATDLPPGTHTLRLTRSATEKNASSSGYRIYADSYSVVGSSAPVGWAEAFIPRVQQSKSGLTTSLVGSGGNGYGAYTIESLAAGDGLYFGSSLKFATLRLTFSAAGVGGSAMSLEYWNGDAWQGFTPVSDGTDGFNQSGTIRLAVPPDWTTTAVNAITAYWIRLSWASGTSAATVSDTEAGVVQDYPSTLVLQAPGSQLEYAYRTNVNADQQHGGELHGGETQTSMAIFVDDLERALEDGEFVQGASIRVEQTCDVADTATIGQGTLRHEWTGNRMTVVHTQTPSVDWPILGFDYPCMFPGLWWSGPTPQGYGFRHAKLLDEQGCADLPYEGCVNASLGQRPAAGTLFTNGQEHDWFVLVCPLDPWHQQDGFADESGVEVRVNPNSYAVPPSGFASYLAKGYWPRPVGITLRAGVTRSAATTYLFGLLSGVSELV